MYFCLSMCRVLYGIRTVVIEDACIDIVVVADNVTEPGTRTE